MNHIAVSVLLIFFRISMITKIGASSVMDGAPCCFSVSFSVWFHLHRQSCVCPCNQQRVTLVLVHAWELRVSCQLLHFFLRDFSVFASPAFLQRFLQFGWQFEVVLAYLFYYHACLVVHSDASSYGCRFPCGHVLVQDVPVAFVQLFCLNYDLRRLFLCY